MTLWHLVIREILYRRLNFTLIVLAVLVAVGALAGAVTLLRAHDINTEAIVAAKQRDTDAVVAAREKEAKASAAALQEVYRKLMLKFGYNLVILPKQEGLVDYQVRGGAAATMDEANVKTLSESNIMTVRHLLPILQAKQVVIAGGKRREVFLVGTRGEVPLAHRAPKKPLLATVGDGQIILGHQVARELGLTVGATVKVVDREFKVIRVYDPRGTSDDASVWIDLEAAQTLLGQEGRINAILALSCVCTFAQLEEIKKDIVRILPDTHVHAMTSNAVIRYEARYHAAQEAEHKVQLARRQGQQDVQRERSARADLKGDIEALVGWMVPLMLVISAAFTAMMALVNVRERRVEIGIWRALGLRGGQILRIFLVKALLAGLAGALLGYAAGFCVAWVWPEAPAIAQLFDPVLPAAVLPLAPLLAVAAAWVPAALAARQDPAVVLREE